MTDGNALTKIGERSNHFWRDLTLQYTLALVFLGGLEVFWITPFDWRSFLWAAVLLGVIRGNAWMWRKVLPKKIAPLAGIPFLLYVLPLLHGILWMFVFQPIKISPETTYVTQRLKPGSQRVDLLSTLERQIFPDVSPEENAFRIFAEKMGPAVIGISDLSDPNQSYRSKEWNLLCEKLRIDPNVEPICFYKPFGVYLEKLAESRSPPPGHASQEEYQNWRARKNDTINGINPCRLERPWTAGEFPDAAEWINETDDAYRVLGETIRAETFFKPFVRVDNDAFHSLDINEVPPHMCVDMLLRIQYHLGRNEPDKAWYDVMTLYHCAEKRQRIACTWELFGNGFELANRLALEVLRHGNLGSETVRQYLDEIRPFHVPPSQRILDNMVLGERLFRLYHVLNFVEIDRPGNSTYVWRLFAWNQELIAMNRHYDAQLGKPIPDVYYLYPEPQVNTYADGAWFLLRKGIFKSVPYFAATEGARSCLCAPMVCAIDCRRTPVHNRLTELAFELELYRHEHGEYPDDWPSLIGGTDPFAPEESFRYKKEPEGGYLLYSVGANGIDDGGLEDPRNRKDDIAVRMPY